MTSYLRNTFLALTVLIWGALLLGTIVVTFFTGAVAMRDAQLDLARNVPGGSHPALWAAFALVGPGPTGRASQAIAAAAPGGG